MKRLFLVSLILLLFLAVSAVAQQRKGKRAIKANPKLTLALAQRILGQQVNRATPDNTMLTCRACYSFEDKAENDSFPVVSTYSVPLTQFLIREGYIRRSTNREEVFTAKAKRSVYFEAHDDGAGGFGGAGLRFASFKNPRVTANKLADLKRVSIEYDFVPNEITIKFFGRVERVKTLASFSYERGRWNLCIACSNQ
jgi:hypothetical protein